MLKHTFRSAALALFISLAAVPAFSQTVLYPISEQQKAPETEQDYPIFVNRMIAGNLKADETGLSVIAPVFRDVVGRETTMTEDDVRSGLDPKRIAMAKRVTGGTAPDEVARQLESRLRAIESDDAELAHRIGRVADAKAKLEREVHEVIG